MGAIRGRVPIVNLVATERVEVVYLGGVGGGVTVHRRGATGRQCRGTGCKVVCCPWCIVLLCLIVTVVPKKCVSDKEMK